LGNREDTGGERSAPATTARVVGSTAVDEMYWSARDQTERVVRKSRLA
jgi:hypothetical protein